MEKYAIITTRAVICSGGFDTEPKVDIEFCDGEKFKAMLRAKAVFAEKVTQAVQEGEFSYAKFDEEQSAWAIFNYTILTTIALKKVDLDSEVK